MYNEIIHKRIDALRSQMTLNEIDFLLITTSDYHSSEYVSDYFKAREHFSGFTGSNGDLLVWNTGAALWTDGRYFIQAEAELGGTGIDLMKMGEKEVPTPEEFLKEKMLPGQKMFVDGRCIPISRGEELEKVITYVNAKACADLESPCDSSLLWDFDIVDASWENRPNLSFNPIWFLTKLNTGESRADRLKRVREEMKKEGAECLVLSSLDDIAWLFLMRGNDIEYNPVALSYAFIFEDKAWLFADESAMNVADIEALKNDNVIIKGYRDIYEAIKDINQKTWADPDRLSYALMQGLISSVGESNIIKKTSPTVIMKACKTGEEIAYEKQAHVKDGVAVTKLLYKLKMLRDDPEFINGSKKVSELEVASELLKLRAEQTDFIEESFAPIIATGEHGAIIHYEPTADTDRPLEKDTFLLMDTGGQYMQGTTDITRTVCMGNPTEEMKKHFTAVLKGHLNLAAAVFPEGTCGPNLDILARKPLWEMGLDFKHGTGHGVGFLLNVHEGPQNISRRGRGGKLGASFCAGMITSDEPGLYIEGKYGIRTENMIVCEPAFESEYGQFFRFEHLTLVPYDRRSIDFSMLSADEISLFNAYNAKIREEILNYLTEDEMEWLLRETEEVKR